MVVLIIFFHFQSHASSPTLSLDLEQTPKPSTSKVVLVDDLVATQSGQICPPSDVLVTPNKEQTESRLSATPLKKRLFKKKKLYIDYEREIFTKTMEAREEAMELARKEHKERLDMARKEHEERLEIMKLEKEYWIIKLRKM